MAEIAAFGKDYGWLTALLVFLIYQGVTKMWPKWFDERSKAARAEREADRIERSERNAEAHAEQTAAIAVYEKFIVAQDATTKFIAQCTACLQSLDRTLDRNTQEIERLRMLLADKMQTKE